MDSVLRVVIQDSSLPYEKRRLLAPGAGFIQLSSGPRISAARNEVVKRFLSPDHGFDAEWLWCIDSDITFPPETLDILLEAADPEKRPVVSGICYGGGRGHIFPMVYRIVDPSANEGMPTATILEWPEHSVFSVDAVGAACLLIHRSVLVRLEDLAKQMAEERKERISPCIWFHESVYKGQEFGEDWTFCMKVRMAGYPIYAVADAKVGHIKTLELNEELWKTGKVPLMCQDTNSRDEMVKQMRQISRQQRREKERQSTKPEYGARL